MSNIKINLNSVFFDILTNVYINDFYLNNFFYIWTQFFLLPTLLILIYCIHAMFFLKNKSTPLVLLQFILFSFMVWWLTEYYILNQYVYSLKHIQYFFNNLLNNPLNKYHPILFFTSYIFIYTTLSYTHTLNNYRTFSSKIFIFFLTNNKIFSKNSYYWVLISFSLYLGAWWALQEGSWGGWWNWDASEVFGLVILIVLLIFFHLRKNYLNQTTVKYTTIIFITIITLLYCILQLSYTLVSHNFGLSLIGYGYVQFFFTLTTIWLLNLLLFLVLNFKFLLKNCILHKLLFYKFLIKLVKPTYIKTLHIVTILLTILVVYISLVSFNPILNNMFWKSFSLEILNKWFSWLNIKLLIILLLWVILLKFNFIIWVLSIFFNVINILYQIPLHLTYILNVQLYLYTLFHLILLFVIGSHEYLQNVLFSKWEYFSYPNILWYGTYNRSPWRCNVATESTYLNTVMHTVDGCTVSISTSFYNFFNNINSQFFSLNLNDNLIYQLIYNHTYLYTFKVNLFDSASMVVDNYSLITLILVVYIFSLKIKIIF